MAELADAQDLGSCAVRRVGTTPTTRTTSPQASHCLRRLLYIKVTGARCVSFYAKGHARFICSVVNTRATVRAHYQLFFEK